MTAQGPAVDKNRLPVPHQALSCSMDARFGSPSQMATEPVACGLSTTWRVASRTSSAMLHADRAAAAACLSRARLRGCISARGPVAPGYLVHGDRVLGSLTRFVVFLPYSKIFYLRLYDTGYSDKFVRLLAASANWRIGNAELRRSALRVDFTCTPPIDCHRHPCRPDWCRHRCNLACSGDWKVLGGNRFRARNHTASRLE